MHYKNGVCSVFGKNQNNSITLIACIEDHQFQPNNFWNGRWRSQWSVILGSTTAELRGILKVQVRFLKKRKYIIIKKRNNKLDIINSNHKCLSKNDQRHSSLYHSVIFAFFLFILMTKIKF